LKPSSGALSGHGGRLTRRPFPILRMRGFDKNVRNKVATTQIQGFTVQKFRGFILGR
jgi:hypothetical protein